VIGVITKGDLGSENEELAIQKLKRLGIAEPYFRVSVPSGTGIRELKEYIFTKESEL